MFFHGELEVTWNIYGVLQQCLLTGTLVENILGEPTVTQKCLIWGTSPSPSGITFYNPGIIDLLSYKVYGGGWTAVLIVHLCTNGTLHLTDGSPMLEAKWILI